MKEVEYIGGNLIEQMQALLHDASEAYMADLPKPIKFGLPDFVQLEDDISRVIMKRYNLPLEMLSKVDTADRTVLHREAYALFKREPGWLSNLSKDEIKCAKRLPLSIPMSSHQASLEFKQQFNAVWSDTIEFRISEEHKKKSQQRL
jgi:5'-deoxynucleotidase YfbR-like HD superfamily hydrolase